MNERLVPVAEVASLLSVGVRTVWRMVSCGNLPTPIKLSSRITRWKLSEIEQHIEGMKPKA